MDSTKNVRRMHYSSILHTLEYLKITYFLSLKNMHLIYIYIYIYIYPAPNHFQTWYFQCKVEYFGQSNRTYYLSLGQHSYKMNVQQHHRCVWPLTFVIVSPPRSLYCRKLKGETALCPCVGLCVSVFVISLLRKWESERIKWILKRFFKN